MYVDELFNLVANVGFPIAVAVFLLVRVEGKINCLTKAITELREAILIMPRDQSQVVYTPARTTAKETL
jgi:hypothetical protein